jgi:hypothetical protein
MTIRVNSPKAFETLLKKDPKGAQAWLKEVAAHSDGLLPADQLATLEKVAAAKGDAFVKGAGKLQLDALFGTAAVAAIADNPAADLPVIHGTLTVARGDKMQLGEQGYREWPDLKLTLKTEDGRTFSLQSDHNQRSEIFTFIPGSDVMAFAGQQVSLRGFLDEKGKVLRVTEFAPGRVDDFVTGRVVLDGNKVMVRSRGRGMVEVTDPELKAELKEHNNLGVILEGKTSEKKRPDGTVARTFDGKASEYWMLVRFTQAPAPSGGGKVSGPIQAATSQTGAQVELPPTEAKNIEVNDRMYVKGRFDGANIKASKATASAGSPWMTASQPRGAPMKSVIEFTEAQDPV